MIIWTRVSSAVTLCVSGSVNPARLATACVLISGPRCSPRNLKVRAAAGVSSRWVQEKTVRTLAVASPIQGVEADRRPAQIAGQSGPRPYPMRLGAGHDDGQRGQPVTQPDDLSGRSFLFLAGAAAGRQAEGERLMCLRVGKDIERQQARSVAGGQAE